MNLPLWLDKFFFFKVSDCPYYFDKKDGIVDNGENAITTIRIPRSCLKHPRKKENLFSLELPADRQTCLLNWKPLDMCRKYRLDVSSQYSAWNSPSSSWEIFTGQEGSKYFKTLHVCQF
jgi:hypothetical protein